jgi:hypothetical protein
MLIMLIVQMAFSQSLRDDINGEWSDQQVTLYNTPEAEVMVRVGDIDNLGFGWPNEFDPFSGASTPSHGYPFSPGPEDIDGTDRIMVITSYNGSPPFGQDGYTNYTSRPENLPRPIVLNYDLNGATVTSATLQIFVDDFQAPVWGANYFVTLNGLQAPYIASQINPLVQTGPIGKIINVAIPQSHLSLVSSGSLSILFDDLTTGAGDGYAIDFVKLLVNPTGYTFTGSISGTVREYGTGNPITGAVVSASGLVESTTNSEGQYTLVDVPAGLINVTAQALGYENYSGFVDLQDGYAVTYNFEMIVAVTPECDTLHYPLAGTPTLFYVSPPEQGYVCGNNTYGDLAKADYFDPDETGKTLFKGFFEFAYVSMGSGQDPDVEFRVWKNNGLGGLPGDVIGTATLPLSEIFDDVSNMLITQVEFDPPVAITTPFYLGVMLPTTTGDTLALVSTDEDEINPGIAYEMWSDLSWFAFSDQGSWQLNIGQAIYAQYCDQGFGAGEETMAPDVLIYPNPASDLIQMQLTTNEPVIIIMTNFLGQNAGSWTFDDAGNIRLPVHDLSAGMYLVTITGKDFRVSRKVLVK